MRTTVDEIAPDTFRLSTLVPEVAPGGFSFNQFLVRDEQPFLFHTGMRGLYPLVSEAVARIVPVADLRWISFGHVEADESGAVNPFLADAPDAQVVHGQLACDISLADLCDRPPRAIAPDEVHDLGSHRLRFLPTPHVPHNWESGLWFDETTRVLFAGDLLSQVGDRAPIVDDDLVEAALVAEDMFHATSRARTWGRPSSGWPSSTRRRWRSCTARRSGATAPPSCAPSPPGTRPPPPAPPDRRPLLRQMTAVPASTHSWGR